MKIFLSFAGKNDLISSLNPDGGAILNICQELKPDKAYLFYNIDSVESDVDYLAAASQTKHALEKLLIDTRKKIKDSENLENVARRKDTRSYVTLFTRTLTAFATDVVPFAVGSSPTLIHVPPITPAECSTHNSC